MLQRFTWTILVVMAASVQLVVSHSVLAKPTLEFLTAKESALELARDDDFLRRMSPFDRAARLKTDQVVSQKAYVAFIQQHTRDWPASDKAAVIASYEAIYPAIEALGVTLPGDIKMILTTGHEEGQAAYTRGNAIMLPAKMVATKERLKRLLAHELFHVYSRQNANARTALYQSIGFHGVDELEFPTALAQQKLTNPDAPINNSAIKLSHQGETMWAMPILFSKSQTYDMNKGGEFFNYLQLKFVVVADAQGKSIYDPAEPRLLAVPEVSGFFEQVGKNTQYIIHPEEILAENFVALVVGETKIASPEVLIKIRQALIQSNRLALIPSK